MREEDTKHTFEGVMIAERYLLRQRLGHGAMGSVWIADDCRLQRKVALKLLAALWAESADAKARFEREAMAAARLRSPHIVQVFDYGIFQERPFMAMELLEGEDLKARLKRVRRLGLDETGQIVLQTSKALRVARQAGLVHRDLKPANIMLDTSTGEELVKVLDFGVVKTATAMKADATTKAGMLLGTPQYMSPEQARGMDDVDHRTDLWALAVIVYRALTGRLPYHSKVVPDLIVKICSTSPIRATAIAPDLPPQVNDFFDKAFSLDRERRFQNEHELTKAYFELLGAGMPSLDGTLGVASYRHSIPGATGPHPVFRDSMPPPMYRDSAPPPIYRDSAPPGSAFSDAPSHGTTGPVATLLAEPERRGRWPWLAGGALLLLSLVVVVALVMPVRDAPAPAAPGRSEDSNAVPPSPPKPIPTIDLDADQPTTSSAAPSARVPPVAGTAVPKTSTSAQPKVKTKTTDEELFGDRY